jgi:hypothetical protein
MFYTGKMFYANIFMSAIGEKKTMPTSISMTVSPSSSGPGELTQRDEGDNSGS